MILKGARTRIGSWAIGLAVPLTIWIGVKAFASDSSHVSTPTEPVRAAGSIQSAHVHCVDDPSSSSTELMLDDGVVEKFHWVGNPPTLERACSGILYFQVPSDYLTYGLEDHDSNPGTYQFVRFVPDR